jgi:hypothetical protein
MRGDALEMMHFPPLPSGGEGPGMRGRRPESLVRSKESRQFFIEFPKPIADDIAKLGDPIFYFGWKSVPVLMGVEPGPVQQIKSCRKNVGKRFFIKQSKTINENSQLDPRKRLLINRFEPFHVFIATGGDDVKDDAICRR